MVATLVQRPEPQRLFFTVFDKMSTRCIPPTVLIDFPPLFLTVSEAPELPLFLLDRGLSAAFPQPGANIVAFPAVAKGFPCFLPTDPVMPRNLQWVRQGAKGRQKVPWVSNDQQQARGLGPRFFLDGAVAA